MTIWGISARSHDAALAVIDNNKLVYASHSERFSRVKNDAQLHQSQIQEALEFGYPSHVFYYEDTVLKKKRQWQAGQYNLLFRSSPKHYLKEFGIHAPVTEVSHHLSHAAYAYYTQPEFENCDIIVVDSIGEYDTTTMWQGREGTLHKIWSQQYPDSIGLWYSAMTQRLGLKPQEHEYILMGMAAFGDANRFKSVIEQDFFCKLPTPYNQTFRLRGNFHRGCMWWRPDLQTEQDRFDIAAAVQSIYEDILHAFLSCISRNSRSNKIALAGGCALNCVANTIAYQYYDKVWIPPNPGDAGSAVGAMLSDLQQSIDFDTAYLGSDIAGKYPHRRAVSVIQQSGVVAVACGRSEFGPRALGHRSILADPRLEDIKDRVNTIKKREPFRPFAPMILSEHVDRYFETPSIHFESDYMQFAINCREPERFPGIVHVDGTSRVQTVPDNDSGPRRLLEHWYQQTGCPMLLNTSLNVRGEPLVNTIDDARRWSRTYSVEVLTGE